MKPSPHTLTSQLDGTVLLLTQSSLLAALPSSQASPATALKKPSPHDAVVQSESQVAEFAGTPPEPPSHCSVTGPRASTWPSPQTAVLQLAGATLFDTQSSVALVLPSSHCSPAAWLVRPSPHGAGVQWESQVGVLVGTPPMPPSQLSVEGPCASVKPSPQIAVRQVDGTVLPLTQSSVLEVLPSSHCSPATALVKLSPQEAVVQLESQVAEFCGTPAMPSSQLSKPTRVKPSPQVALLQLVRQASV